MAGESDVLTRTEHIARVQNPDTRILHNKPTYICCTYFKRRFLPTSEKCESLCKVAVYLELFIKGNADPSRCAV